MPLCPETFQSLRYGHAACHSAGLGAFMLGFAGSVAAAPSLFGQSAVTPLLRLWYGFGFDHRSFVILATVFVAVGFWQLVLGVRSALTHDDRFSVASFSIALGLALLVVNYWADAPAMLGVNAALVHAFFLALLADCAMNFWLQLRGFMPRGRASTGNAAPLSVRAAMLAHNARLALVAAERDRALAERDNMARVLEVQQEAAGLLALPGVGRAVLSVLHPDRFTSEADKRLATARFQAASAVLEKIGARR